MNWNIDVSMLKNSSIIKQLFFCLGLPFILIGAIMSLSARNLEDSLEILSVFGWIFIGFSIATILIILIIFGGKNKLSFSMDSNGVFSETRQEQAKKGRIISFLAIIAGLFARKPAVIGAGMLSGARGATEGIKWKDVQEIKYKPSSRTIILKQNIFHRIYVFCLPENYTEVTEYIQARMQEVQTKKARKEKKTRKTEENV